MPKNMRPPLYRPPWQPTAAQRRADWERASKRPDAVARGYDGAWARLRAEVLRDEPYCRMCAAEGVMRDATLVDHVIPVAVRPDLRLNRANLQPLCDHHHLRKTHAEMRGCGTP
jgi:5-methylcytosine-specific restriction protein A